MIYMMLIILFFSISILFRKYTCRHTWFFAMMGISLALTLWASVLYIAKLGNYHYTTNPLFLPDYELFKFFTKIRISYYTILRIRNIGIATYLFISTLFAVQIASNNRFTFRGKNKFFFLLLFPLFYIWFYDSNTRYSLYILYMESNRAYANRLEALLILIDLLNYIGIFVYLFAPIIRLVRMFFNTTLEIKKRQIFSMIICISILNMFFWGFTILGPFKQIYALNFPQILLSFPKSFEVNIVMSEVIPIIMLLIMQAMLVILLKFNGLDSVDFFREAKIKRNVKGLNSLNQNLRSVFHSFKNTLFTIQILAEQAQNNTELEASQNAIQRISTITADSMDSIIHLSDSFREIHLKTYKSSMVKVLEEAIERVKFPENIRLIREFREPKVESVVDSYYIIDVLTNILQNSCEAIKAAKQKEGIIKIELFTEHEWVVMKITDNGTGITKKEQEKIFNPFYTTKPGKDNWGIGLSYAFRIIKAHLGFITMSSKKDEYTTFQILLYRAEEQENG